MLKRLLLIVLLLLPGIGVATTPILIIGDSLSAAYGINPRDGWVALLAQRLKNNRHSHSVINASISGETTSGALSRTDKLLADYSPAIVIIALGANDGLRGLSSDRMYENLAAIINLSIAQNSDVLLIGIHMPPNYGQAYIKKLSHVYQRLAKRFDIALLPTLLEGVEENNALFQSDGFHPGSTAQLIILDNVWRHLEPLLSQHASSTLPKRSTQREK